MFGPNFYPTPRSVAAKMLAKISPDAVDFLEPSAGKGDLAEAIAGQEWERRHRNRKVDCIEIEPELSSILREKGFSVVGHDWTTYAGVCYYDAILMNPPFSEGDDHLLRAWDFLHDGEIVCLLNEETIKNPCNASRVRLAAIISDHGSVEYLGDCFKTAQRPTGVNVAMVYLKKVSDDDRVELWATGTPEKEVNADIGASGEDAMLAVRDVLGNMQHYYDIANVHMLKAFEHVRKAALYMDANGISTGQDYEHIVGMALRNTNAARAALGRKHRRDAWYRVFEKMAFHKWLDKKQTDAFLRDVETHGNFPFTAQNIKDTLENVISQRKRLFEQSVANVFDELTRHFKGNSSGDPGSGDGVTGWKSNENFKVNMKLVFPWGCRFDGKFCKKFDRLYSSNSPINLYNDLDRVLCILDGAQFENCYTIGRAMDRAFDVPGLQEAQSQYFDIRFYKKGTVHLRWRRRDLWAKFNTTAAAGKQWLGQNTKEAA